MTRNPYLAFLLAAGALTSVAAANGTEVLVTTDIAVSTTWTADNHYNLQTQIYVLPGATLTIEAGTIIASETGLGGSLAVSKGAQIFVQGTASEPVIMTSKADMATWTNSDPKTGVWREAANEWGNLTIMGSAYISENATSGNSPVPSASNVAAMEGLVADFPGDTKVLYGGGDDDDDSGSVRYLSLRYGGKVVGLNNELNGLSLGGIGRGTDFSHIEIMNNVDDGIEIWGGTLNIKYFSIWNVGDDSFDVDQGWRGKAQFGLIVQGYSLNANQGSGVGDNAFETDGAEDSDWQPVTTASIYNCTVIGQPVDGDQGTAWRDNARVQYRNCVFMDLGDRLIKNDGDDGDGASGYGHNGTLSFDQTWNTSFSVNSTVNAPANPGTFYQSQSSGSLAEMSDCVFFRNLNASAYTEATNQGVLDAASNNVLIPGFDPADAPIQGLQRGAAVVRGGKTMLPVIFLDPTPANEALTSVNQAPADGFFTAAGYRGAFAPGHNWLENWSAASAFGMTTQANSLGEIYCAPAQLNSAGAGATITAIGSDKASLNDVTLVAGDLPSNQFFFFLNSQSAGLISGPGGSQGNLCVVGSIGRYNSSILNSGASGSGSLVLDLTNTPTPSSSASIVTGETWHFQLWYRDLNPGPVSNFSDAISILFQ